MSLHLLLDRSAAAALYRQIAEQIKDRISAGQLPVGSQLPTVRQLAETLGVTRLTVQNAYAELQSSGWIDATVGRGTFVRATPRTSNRLAERSAPLTADLVIDDMLEIAHAEGVRSLANASPDARLFPADEFWGVLQTLRSQAIDVAEYGAIQGDAGLRIELAALLRERGVSAMPDEILVTNGATQALALVTQALCRPGDVVLVEQPTYLSFLNILRGQGVQAIGVPMDEGGPDTGALERLALQHRPRFFYTIPAFHNPTGRCMEAARQQQVLEIAERFGFYVLEDDIYARMAYGRAAPPALKHGDRADVVVYVSSFSKVFMPGLRIGYVMAPPPLLRRLVDLRRATDLTGPLLLQRTMAEFLRGDGLKRHLRRVTPVYQERRDALLQALRSTMPGDVTWTRPAGGFCCWLTLPPRPVFGDLYQAALRQGWAFAPGEVFMAQPDGRQHVRICFGQQTPETIRSGVALLAQLIRVRLDQADPAPVQGDWTPMV